MTKPPEKHTRLKGKTHHSVGGCGKSQNRVKRVSFLPVAVQPSTKYFLIRSSVKSHQQEKEKSSLCAQGDFMSTFKALKGNQSSLLLELWVLCRWLLWPSIKAVIRSQGTSGGAPGADQAGLFWVRGQCVWCRKELRSQQWVLSTAGCHGNMWLQQLHSKWRAKHWLLGHWQLGF